MGIKVNKQEILKEFNEKYIADRWVNEFVRIDERYKNNAASIEKYIFSKFDSACGNAVSLQERGLKGEIKFINFSVLRTDILENKGSFRIDLYDEKWFLDKEECSENIDLDFIYSSLFKHMKELKKEKNEYGRNITDMDIEDIKLIEAEKYNILAVEYLKSVIEKMMEVPCYKQMKKSEDIKIMAGEYMDASEIIYPKQEENTQS